MFETLFIGFIFISVGGFVAIFILSQLFFTVQQQHVAILQTLGKFSRTCGAGLHFKIPLIESVAGRVSLRVEQLDTMVDTKTKDNVFTKVRVSVQYFIEPSKVFDAFYRLENPHQQISSFVFDSVRAQVPGLSLDALFERKDDIAVQLKTDLDETMSGFGFSIYRALITDIEPDQKVRDAMNEINAQHRLKLATIEKAEGAKFQVVKAAEAEAEGKKLQGIGIAEQRKAIIDGLRESVEKLQSEIHGVNANEVMMLVLMTQYFDTMKDVAAHSKTNTLFIPNSATATGDLMQEMRMAFMQAHEATKATKATNDAGKEVS